ncbi:MAG: RNA polymerase sigma factor [Candidatus Dojkabacteria bacterium]|nr:RNA polymerase sigma factor [Candidatus Dojkabacteria bacterium]
MDVTKLKIKKLVRDYIKTRSNIYFGEIYKRSVDDVYRFVYSRTGDKSVSEDITSEVFITLIDVIDKYNFKVKFTTFVYGIAFNKIRQHWQKNKKTFEIFEETNESDDIINNEYAIDSDVLENIEKKEVQIDEVIKPVKRNSRHAI